VKYRSGKLVFPLSPSRLERPAAMNGKVIPSSIATGSVENVAIAILIASAPLVPSVLLQAES